MNFFLRSDFEVAIWTKGNKFEVFLFQVKFLIGVDDVATIQANRCCKECFPYLFPILIGANESVKFFLLSLFRFNIMMINLAWQRTVQAPREAASTLSLDKMIMAKMFDCFKILYLLYAGTKRSCLNTLSIKKYHCKDVRLI